MFKKPFSFEGRIRRTEYCLSVGILVLCGITLGSLADYLNMIDEIENYFIILLIPAAWFYLAQATKRCHDRGNSGFFQFIPFYRYWMIFANSDYGDNRYGPNPKGLGNNYDDIDELGNHII